MSLSVTTRYGNRSVTAQVLWIKGTIIEPCLYTILSTTYTRCVTITTTRRTTDIGRTVRTIVILHWYLIYRLVCKSVSHTAMHLLEAILEGVPILATISVISTWVCQV